MAKQFKTRAAKYPQELSVVSLPHGDTYELQAFRSPLAALTTLDLTEDSLSIATYKLVAVKRYTTAAQEVIGDQDEV